MNPWQQLLLVWAVAAVAQAFGWLWQRKRANAGIVDVVWSFGVGGAAVLGAATGSGALLPRVLLAVLGGAWGLRLGLHLHRAEAERRPGVVGDLEPGVGRVGVHVGLACADGGRGKTEAGERAQAA